METIVVPKEMKEYIKVYENYYKLKIAYEKKLKKKKKDIMKAEDISMEKKLFKIKNLKMTCIQCGGDGGTNFYRENRVLYARCKAAVPCDLNIELNISKTYFLPDNLKENIDYLNELKKQIVLTKLNYLFDLEKDDITSQKFKVKKDEFVIVEKQANIIKKLLEQQLTLTEVENEAGESTYAYKKNVIQEKTKMLNAHINDMQSIIESHKRNPDSYNLEDAIAIYKNNILPLLEDMRRVKYDVMYMDSEQYTDDFVGSKQKNVMKQVENGIQSYCHIEEAGQIVQNKISAPVKKKRKRKKKKIIINKKPEKEVTPVPEEETQPEKEEEFDEEAQPEKELQTVPQPEEDFDMAAFDETDKSKPSTSDQEKMSDLDELEEFDPKVES